MWRRANKIRLKMLFLIKHLVYSDILSNFAIEYKELLSLQYFHTRGASGKTLLQEAEIIPI